MQRKIIHCDADCFFAAIEQRDDPMLENKAVAVGGNKERRGVIATCNYEARQYGVRSAMPTAHALRLCPELIVIPPNMEKYIEASRLMRNIFYDYTDLVEPLSLDEAFLDVTESNLLHGSATLIAEDIRKRIREDLRITVSAGVANSKFLAKIASDMNKPDGIFVLPPPNIEKFLAQLPVEKIFGVGKVTREKMRRMEILTCEDLRSLTIFELVDHFGSQGKQLYELCRGIDKRPVQPKQKRKSLSVENTYSIDIPSIDECMLKTPELFVSLKSRLNRMGQFQRITKIFAKIKFSDFSTTTIEKSGVKPSQKVFDELITAAFTRKNLPARLLGIGVRFINEQEDDEFVQLELFEKFPELMPKPEKK